MDTNEKSNEEFYVWLKHNPTYLQRCSRSQNKCSKPCKSHKCVAKAAPAEIKLQLSIDGEKLNDVSLIPGQNLQTLP